MIASKYLHPVLIAAALLGTAPCALAQMMAPVVQYEGRWELQPNGDVKLTRTFKLPSQLYTQWKNNDVHMLEARNFASERSNVEVAAKRADWDDLNQTLTMSLTYLGLAQNKGGHWEAKILPTLEFSNLDEVRKIAFFHFLNESKMGRIQGQDLIVLPPTSTKPAWDSARKAVVYTMPPPELARFRSGSATRRLSWVAGGVCLVAGIGLWGLSLLLPAPARAQPVKPQPAAPNPGG